MPYFPASQRYALPYRAIAMRRERDMLLQAAEAAASLESPTVLASSRSDRRVNGGPAASNLKLVADEDGFGAQGGDPGRGVDMDLSTCVNRYAPMDAAHTIAFLIIAFPFVSCAVPTWWSQVSR
jgi:hypothetical protein